MTEHRRVVIIGSGPAGLTAAIYAARADLAPLVIEGEISSTSDQPGGQLMLTTEVENFPGFPAGIMGPELMTAMRAQAERFGATFVTARASALETAERPFAIWTGDRSTEAPSFHADALIVATGARSLMLGLEGERRLLGHGVSTCATCDGFFFRDRRVIVVGGGDSALEEAMFLSKFASSVTVLHRRHELRASKIMQDRAFRNTKLSFRWNCVVEEVIGADALEAVRIRDVETGDVETLRTDGLFVAIGHAPNTDMFAGLLDMDAAGYLRTHDGTHTSTEGIFACGDVQDHVYRQAITAAGSGCSAAIDAERWLEAVEHQASTAAGVV